MLWQSRTPAPRQLGALCQFQLCRLSCSNTTNHKKTQWKKTWKNNPLQQESVLAALHYCNIYTAFGSNVVSKVVKTVHQLQCFGFFPPPQTISSSARHLVLNLQFQMLLHSSTPISLFWIFFFCPHCDAWMQMHAVPPGFHSFICIKCDRGSCCCWWWWWWVEGNKQKNKQALALAPALLSQTQSDGLFLRSGVHGRGLDDALRQPSDPRCAAPRVRWHRNRLRGAWDESEAGGPAEPRRRRRWRR